MKRAKLLSVPAAVIVYLLSLSPGHAELLLKAESFARENPGTLRAAWMGSKQRVRVADLRRAFAEELPHYGKLNRLSGNEVQSLASSRVVQQLYIEKASASLHEAFKAHLRGTGSQDAIRSCKRLEEALSLTGLFVGQNPFQFGLEPENSLLFFYELTHVVLSTPNRIRALPGESVLTCESMLVESSVAKMIISLVDGQLPFLVPEAVTEKKGGGFFRRSRKVSVIESRQVFDGWGVLRVGKSSTGLRLIEWSSFEPKKTKTFQKNSADLLALNYKRWTEALK